MQPHEQFGALSHPLFVISSEWVMRRNSRQFNRRLYEPHVMLMKLLAVGKNYSRGYCVAPNGTPYDHPDTYSEVNDRYLHGDNYYLTL
ncbi:hypothetical protein PROFUN_05998 [Planoprotostelium fungivorum]|uniref:Uncharacterized protein n=1 Tax=Planoprotostelium fungivorum TaxID=1890364 RepID=A0A2P6NPD0_9EUKA|nr:hypothetical protein PROFUN_05998 [Planoprotostelium fungivorum]